MEVSGQLHTPAALSPGKNPGNVIRRTGGPQGQFGTFEEEKT